MKQFTTLLLLFSLFIGGGIALAIDTPEEMLPNPVQEKRAEHLGAQLRCLVCQNESIEESSAPLARDLRKAVREQVAAGKTDQQIMDWMTERYGEFIRLAPTFSFATALLWLMPAIAIISGGLLAWFAMRRRPIAHAPLTEEERIRLKELSGQE
ncbi:cytochrome c-type biogenesis protein [Swingsia samuiensis]|uniref:Cytochrome c-type biogenesis protein n=1 Tax=Swingsia samuiensis TaxID=1293412 RepID=A0A4Y6UI32_9PROT|nr:cytochrome c-type biogenesis protein [Swingsia samuiensis]QDH17259.1 cytochrome c-type biogenesis protein CcmH [Swingsia samuiensis]